MRASSGSSVIGKGSSAWGAPAPKYGAAGPLGELVGAWGDAVLAAHRDGYGRDERACTSRNHLSVEAIRLAPIAPCGPIRQLIHLRARRRVGAVSVVLAKRT